MLSRSRCARLVLAVSAVAGAVMAVRAQTPVPDGGASGRPEILRVESVEQLAAVTPEEKELAEYFRGGCRVLGPEPPPPVGGVSLRWSCVATAVVAPFPTTTYREIRRGHVCSNAVVVGAPVSHRVILNADGRGMVSVYRIAVSRWIGPLERVGEPVVGEPGGQAFVKDFLYEGGKPDLWLNGPSIFVLHRGWRVNPGPRIAYALGASSPVIDGHTIFEGLDGPIESVVESLQALTLRCGDPPEPYPPPLLQLQLSEGR